MAKSKKAVEKAAPKKRAVKKTAPKKETVNVEDSGTLTSNDVRRQNKANG